MEDGDPGDRHRDAIRSAKDAPQAVQDANALWLLRQYGPNSTTSRAESGPYGTGGSGGADFSTTVYGVAPVGGGGTAPGYDGGFAPSGMSTDQMMALPTIARMGGLPALVGAGRGGTAFNPAALTGLGTKLLFELEGDAGVRRGARANSRRGVAGARGRRWLVQLGAGRLIPRSPRLALA